jgi:hypothetical protein
MFPNLDGLILMEGEKLKKQKKMMRGKWHV